MQNRPRLPRQQSTAAIGVHCRDNIMVHGFIKAPDLRRCLYSVTQQMCKAHLHSSPIDQISGGALRSAQESLPRCFPGLP